MRAFAALFALTSAVVGQQRPCPQAGATRDTIVRPAFPPAPATGVGSAGDIAGALARARGEASTSTRPHADGGVAATAAAAIVAPLRAMIANTTECKAALLMYELALALLPARAPLAEAFEALRLDVDCGAPAPPPRAPGPLRGAGWTAGERAVRCLGGEVTVDATAGVDARGRGARDAPLRTIRAAVDALRASRHASIPVEPACVVLRGGTHFVGDTIALGAADSAVSFVADADDSEPAWVSGGVALEGLGAWQQRGAAPDGSPIWAASLPDTLDVITAMPSLNTLAPLNRLTNSQFPNYDVETDSQEVAGPWGGGGAVSEWVKPALYPLPTVLWKDLSGLKNDSTMDCYNHYSTGTGGPCDHWKGDMGGSGNYYCGNSSDGGWVEVDANMQKSGLLLFPMAAKLNMSVIADDYSGKNFDAWKIPPFKSFTGTPVATLTVWQGAPGGGGEWYNNRFVITDYDTATSVMNLSADGIWPSGGWQGGRVWHTLDAPQNKHDGPLIGGPWHVNGIASELDVQGEYFFDAGARELLFIWNTSLLPPGQAPLPPSSPPPASLLFVAPQTEVFFNVTGTPTAPVRDVSFVGLGFRDQRDGFLEPWCNPGSGDWALRRAGAITLRGTERALVSGCAFVRTDGNAVHVDKYARNTTIEDTEFVWLGMSAVTLMGDTEEDDATAATQPWGTVLSRNLVHEIGILEKQSSALFLGKSALTRVEHCVFFNGPRAMINFNDYTGGGDNVTSNAIWNTCRESGDHGPLNSWNRMPFATRLASGGGEASYRGLHSEVSHNYIWANYGGSQGENIVDASEPFGKASSLTPLHLTPLPAPSKAFDTDDGSSFFYIRENAFFMADLFKTDYGGHDSIVESNICSVRTYDGQACINVGDYVPGYETTLAGNTCILPPDGSHGDPNLVDSSLGSAPCDGGAPGAPITHDNSYFTSTGVATVDCGNGTKLDVRDVPPPTEARATVGFTPSDDTIIEWFREKLIAL